MNDLAHVLRIGLVIVVAIAPKQRSW